MFNSIAVLEPCWLSGIRTNEARALTAAVLSCTIPALTAGTHRLFNPAPPEAVLASGSRLLAPISRRDIKGRVRSDVDVLAE
jgi:hypothetical protein